jgi:2-oxoglutarate ferredoxin oxidoreductase subunit delta
MAIYVDGEICKGCQLCIHFCPKKVFEVGEEVNDKGFVIPKIAHEDQCIKCKICELICPDLAIFVED